MKNKPYVFETLRWPQGFFSIQQHISRLQKSAIIMHMPPPTKERVVEAFGEITTIHPVRLRLEWNGESIHIDAQPLPIKSNMPITVLDRVFERPFPYAKYATQTYARVRQLQPEGVMETLFFTQKGFLLEGNITNVFAVLDEELCTPPLSSILPGLMREWICTREAVKERNIHKKELIQASEIFVTNSLRGVLSVGSWGAWKSKSHKMADALRQQLRLLKE